MQTRIGPIAVRWLQVRDRLSTASGPIRFTSAVLPPHLRRARSFKDLFLLLFFTDISTGDFSEAIVALLGPISPCLSATTIAQLTAKWAEDCDAWQRRHLSAGCFIYFCADGVYVQPRFDPDWQCLLVTIGTDVIGNKDFVGLSDGYRESTECWLELIVVVKRRGLVISPELAVGGGALGLWAALRQVHGPTRQQQYWVHKTANVLNEVPKDLKGIAKNHVRETWTYKTKGYLSRTTALAMVVQHLLGAKRRWRRLDGSNKLAELI